MNVYGRILKVGKKSTLLWQNGEYIEVSFASKHDIGDIIDKKDNLITKCEVEYSHKKDKKLYEKLKNKFLYIKKMRNFFENEGFLEVATPKLKESIVEETNIAIMKMQYGYLAPSPEAEIKKLISLGFDKLFELCFAYRNDHENSLHKKEFFILEWYRAMETPQKITEDLLRLIKYLNNGDILEYKGSSIKLDSVEYIKYKDLFLKYADIDIDDFDVKNIKKVFNLEGDMNRFDVLDAVFSIKIEKNLGLEAPSVVYNFPKERAALSRIEKGYARRFETYIAGVELSNCYDEENNYEEIAARFKNTDSGFFDAIKKGIPSMSGIAVGVDRLIMLLDNLGSI